MERNIVKHPFSWLEIFRKIGIAPMIAETQTNMCTEERKRMSLLQST